ncbi:sensor histidine kinase [uncultured Dysosmobacter sp.]|uniref:sensor histidine kinase n=1 Tax=uncultured Dysosmobacter sp. TaxID=2591384 RepID=UPI00262055F4|nr:histidine kinase [uncultured Dysosmobacter sp.]
MEHIRQLWCRMSIRLKCMLLMGTLLAALWFLVVAAMLQLQSFSRKSDVIMNEYIDITGFMDAFSAENVCLEAYIRPILDAEASYQKAIAATDRCLEKLRPDWQMDQPEEYALKRAICNAMEHYRNSQAILLQINDQDLLIDEYLSLKTQAAYIDGYTRDLLHGRMVQGGEQWNQIAAANDHSIQRFAGFLLVVTILTVLALLLFTRSILQPLTDLGRAADAISTGCYDAPPLDIRSMDELGRTARSFNQMQLEIRSTIDSMEKQAEMEKHLLEKEVEAVQMQRRLQEGRFAQLQSQINPHFLFNTLNTIAALAREEKAPLSENLIMRLSSFFRYSLESDEKLVPLERELRLLQDYIELQETRYGDRITMEVTADPALGDVIVPKFILQPLVENAILHGLRSCPGGGHIRVRAWQGRRGVTLTVTDNGCGFDSSRPPVKTRHKSVGLDNIRERMELSGGRLDVFSIPGIGTTARIIIGEGKQP